MLALPACLWKCPYDRHDDVGTKLILHKTFDAENAFRQRYKATIFDGVPTMYMFMLNSPSFKKADLSSLQRCYVGGQTMPVATMKAVEEGFNVLN